MKFRLSKEINYFEIDPNFHLKLGSLFKLLQEAAILHSERVGMGAKAVSKKGVTWVLSKMGIDIERYPLYKEKIEILTWSTGLKGLKAFREFEVYAGEQKIAAVSSVWFLLDIQSKKIQRVPPELIDIYTTETDIALQRNLDNWKTDASFTPEREISLTTRSSDYDPNGHVNNSVYIEYLETLIWRLFGEAAQVKSLNIFFAREINRKIDALSLGFKQGESGLFKIYQGENFFAGGDFQLKEK